MPDDDVQVLERPEARDRARQAVAPGWLRCRTCGHRVAPLSAATSFDGGHGHCFSNPHGYRFRIRLFAAAPGCVHEGAATEYFSWFPGYAWRVACCGGCCTHLGWEFSCIGAPGPGEPGGFHGLIGARLEG